MVWFMNCLSGFLGCLCRAFGVTPDTIKTEKDKNPSSARKD